MTIIKILNQENYMTIDQIWEQDTRNDKNESVLAKEFQITLMLYFFYLKSLDFVKPYTVN